MDWNDPYLVSRLRGKSGHDSVATTAQGEQAPETSVSKPHLLLLTRCYHLGKSLNFWESRILYLQSGDNSYDNIFFWKIVLWK